MMRTRLLSGLDGCAKCQISFRQGVVKTCRRAQMYIRLRLSFFAIQQCAWFSQRGIGPFHRQTVCEIEVAWKDIRDDFVLDESLFSLLCACHIAFKLSRAKFSSRGVGV